MAHSIEGKLRISQSLIGNTRRLGTKQSDETKAKQSLALKGKWAWNKGKRLSDVTRNKMSLARKGVIRPWMHRTPSDDTKRKLMVSSKQAWETPETRKKYHLALSKTKWIKVRSDIGQLELLEKWNRLGFRFESNYQLRTETDLFYLDGYDPIHKVVFEYDGKYHQKTHQQQRDLIRQQKIIDTLQPIKFWRYNAPGKTFSNIIGQCDGQ